MKSKWFEYKEQVILLRKKGYSITTIEKEFSIPRSTLSGWFKSVKLTEQQRTRLMLNKRDGWKKARETAVLSHHLAKAKRLSEAKSAAQKTLDGIEINDEILDLAFSMLYFGEGAKNGLTSISSSNPIVLKFVIYVLKRNYGLTDIDIKFELHLRMDQKEKELRKYWSEALGMPIDRFGYTAYDKRSQGKKTFDNYKGVCVLRCGNIAIQRKLIFLYSMFCEKISKLEMGA